MATEKKSTNRLFIFVPMVLAIVIIVGYSATWVYASGVMKDLIAEFIEDEAEEGRIITYEHIKVRGFPVALRAEIDNFEWAEPGQWEWSGDRLNVITLPYDITRIILAPRGAQDLIYDGEHYDIDAAGLNVSLSEFAYSAEAQSLIATGGGQTLSFGRMRANWDIEEDGSWTFLSRLTGVEYTDPQNRSLISSVTDVSLAKAALDPMIRINTISITATDMMENPSTVVSLDGDIGVSPEAYPQGQMGLSVQNADKLLDLAEHFELTDDRTLSEIRTLLGASPQAQAGLIGPVPVGMRDGVAYIGFSPSVGVILGELPRLQ